MNFDIRPLRKRLPGSMAGYVRRCATIDTRSLAVFRMLAGVLIVADVISRSRNFSFYYTDDGVVPQSLAELYTREHAVSIFFLTEDPTIIAALFGLHAFFAVVLFIGYKTRLMLIISFFFVISLDHHNPFVLSYADTLFRMLLFWAIFLPLGERWSIDALHRDRSPRKSVASLATAAIMIQMLFMYFVNGQNKFPSERWHSGEAAIIVMGIDEMTFLLGDTMRAVPTFLQIGGRMWFYLLVASPLLILLYGRSRYPMLAGFVGGHASFAITVRIGAFPYVAILGLITFLQPRFWSDANLVLAKLGLGRTTDNIYARAKGGGEHVARLLPGRLIEFPAREILVRRTITVLVLVSMLGLFVWPAFAFTAEGPYLDESPLPEDGPIDDIASHWSVPQPEWSIFAGPGPRNIDRYYVFPAETTDGEVFDIYNDRPLTYERPGQELQRQHSVYRERFYMNSIRRGGQNSRVVSLYADHLCETWSEENDGELAHINMYEIRERITVDTIDDPDERSRWVNEIAYHSCGDEPSQIISPPPSDFEDD